MASCTHGIRVAVSGTARSRGRGGFLLLRCGGAAHAVPGSLALSIDNLAVGFALGTYHVGLLLAVVVIGAGSVALSPIGLELGGRRGTKIGERGDLIGGLVLIGVGVAIAAGAL